MERRGRKEAHSLESLPTIRRLKPKTAIPSCGSIAVFSSVLFVLHHLVVEFVVIRHHIKLHLLVGDRSKVASRTFYLG